MPNYTPRNYEIYNRAWSILYALYIGLGKPGAGASYIDLVLDWERVEESNFWFQKFEGVRKLPLFVGEYRGGTAGGFAGVRGETETWEITILAADETNISGRGANADVQAMAMDVRSVLSGQKIPYYEYSRFEEGYGGNSLHESNYRVQSKDFSIQYVNMQRGSEADERDRNAVRIVFAVKV